MPQHKNGGLPDLAVRRSASHTRPPGSMPWHRKRTKSFAAHRNSDWLGLSQAGPSFFHGAVIHMGMAALSHRLLGNGAACQGQI